MSETKEEVLENIDVLKTEMSGLKPVLPVASGGLHPKLVPALMKYFGKDFVIQAGGGIHGHTNGTFAGATAMRQAVDATMQQKTLEERTQSSTRSLERLNQRPKTVKTKTPCKQP